MVRRLLSQNNFGAWEASAGSLHVKQVREGLGFYDGGWQVQLAQDCGRRLYWVNQYMNGN